MPHPKPQMLKIGTGKRKPIFRTYKRKSKNKLRQHVLSKFNFTCCHCNQPYPDYELHNDHIIPLTKGGEDTIDNCQCLCIKCHTIKSISER